MNTKILKYELFTLYFLTLVTLFVFYYKEALPDSYLSISSNEMTTGFFTYYSTSFLNFINYYSGPWVFIPCAIFTSFYVLIFSKRADVIDVFNILFLSLTTLCFIFFIQPSLLGPGLYQILNSGLSGFSMFAILMGSLILFLWGAFRGDFVTTVKAAAVEIKDFNYQESSGAIQEKWLQFKNRFAKKESCLCQTQR